MLCSNRIFLRKEQNHFCKGISKIKSRQTKSVPDQNLKGNKHEKLGNIKNMNIREKTKLSTKLR